MVVADSAVLERFKDTIDLFEITAAEGAECIRAILDSLQWALDRHYLLRNVPFDPNITSFMALDTCINKLPTGSEIGDVYGVDVGGSNLRVVKCLLQGGGNVDVKMTMVSLQAAKGYDHFKEGLMDSNASAGDLFGYIGRFIHSSIEQLDLNLSSKPSTSELRSGLCFSFGLDHTALDQAILLTWAKGFATGTSKGNPDPVIGRDVVRLLNRGITSDRTYKGPNVSVVCALNDTVGTMVTGAYEKPSGHPDCLMGVIVGTGYNVCYYEDEAKSYGYKGNIINLEAGGFRHINLNAIDNIVDLESINPGRQRFEKVISGLYLGDLFRVAMLRVFKSQCPDIFHNPRSMDTSTLAKIYSAKDTAAVRAVLLEDTKWDLDNVEYLSLIQRLAQIIMIRSARYAALMVTAIAFRTRRMKPCHGGLTVAFDGSVYVKNEWYSHEMKRYISSIIGAEMSDLIHFVIAQDGSGKGAGILAAAS